MCFSSHIRQDNSRQRDALLSIHNPRLAFFKCFTRELWLVLDLDFVARDEHREDGDAFGFEEPARIETSARIHSKDNSPSAETRTRAATEREKGIPRPVTTEPLRLEGKRLVPIPGWNFA